MNLFLNIHLALLICSHSTKAQHSKGRGRAGRFFHRAAAVWQRGTLQNELPSDNQPQPEGP